jgi:hypothetical protein
MKVVKPIQNGGLAKRDLIILTPVGKLSVHTMAQQ